MLRDITNDVAQESNEATCYSGDEGDEESSSSSDSDWESSPAGTPNTKSSFTSAAVPAPASPPRDGAGATPGVDNAGLYYGDDFDPDYADADELESDDERNVDEDEDDRDEAGSDVSKVDVAHYHDRQFGWKVRLDGGASNSNASRYDDMDPFGGCAI